MISKKKKIFIKRIISDIKDIKFDPVEGIHIHYNEEDLSTIRCLIIGPKDTPYEDGLYYFTLNFPDTYPFTSPSAKFETINGEIRFNPNLYESGKVCLSILGTWHGPKWSSIQTLKSVLLSIQSLMNENPINNEPNYEKVKSTEDRAIAYNEYIRYHNYSFALLEMVKKKSFYPYFTDIVKIHFLENYEKNIKKLEELTKLDGKVMTTFIWSKKIKIDYTKLIHEYKKVYNSLTM